MKELSEFVISPFINKNESVITLFNYLRKLHPEFEDKQIEKETVHSKIFKGIKYNDAFMRSLIFKLSEIAEKYLAYKDLETTAQSYNNHLINALLEKGLDKHAGKFIKESELKSSKKKNTDADYFYNQFKIEKFKYLLYSKTYNPLTVKDKPSGELLYESDALLKFFLISILQRYRYLLNKKKTVSADFHLTFLNEIITFLDNEGKHFKEVPLISILIKQIELMQHPERKEIFFELRNMLMDDSLIIDGQELRDSLTVLTNYCIDKRYEEGGEYMRYIYENEKFIIEKDLYNRTKGGYFETALFNNVVATGLFVNDLEGILNFIQKYLNKLAPDARLNAYNFSYSKYYFKIKDFRKALLYASKVKYSDIFYKINLRIHAIAIHYELNNFDEVVTMCETFKKFLTNDKLITDQNRSISANFIKFALILNKLKMNRSGKKLDGLKSEIESCKALGYRTWLLDKTNELIAVLNKS